MAVYFDHSIEAPDSSDVPFQLTWHSSLPILAVASSSPATGGKVDLYLQQVTSDIKVCNISLILTHKYRHTYLVHIQGEHVESCHVVRPHQPTGLRWHPTKPVLAVGWDNGEVVLLTHPSGDQTVLPGVHTTTIKLLEWSSFGSRLVTGDEVSLLQ